MPDQTRKPRTGGRPARGLKKGNTSVNNCLNSITKPHTTQLFGAFDHDSKNAVISRGIIDCRIHTAQAGGDITMTTKKTKKTATPPATIEPTATPAPLTEREKRAALLPTMKDNSLILNNDQAEYLFDIFKTDHKDVLVTMMRQAVCGFVNGESPQPEIDYARNITLRQLAELKPESYLESMLCVQMVQVNNALAETMHKAFAGGNVSTKEMNANIATKLSRTFLAQIEALQKLRGKSGQKVTVEHVTVNAGGQAIVGTVDHGGGAAKI